MSIDRSISCGTGQIFVFSVWNVEVCFWVAIFFCKPEINHVNLIATLANTHEKVIRFDIPVDERLGVDIFDTRDLEVCQ